MHRYDIREYKHSLRENYREIRAGYSPEEKQRRDRSLLQRVQKLYQYRNAKTILCYVSTPIEVGTRELITQALAEGKRVAVPRCVDDSREMEFYLIHSLEDLEPRTFGVLEPVLEKCELLRDFSGSICLVPGLAFDLSGFRLGYGKGYYDRFLFHYHCPKIGIVYADCVCYRLPHGRYDVAVDLLVTENYIRRIQRIQRL